MTQRITALEIKTLKRQYKVLFIIGVLLLFILMMSGEHIYSVCIWKVHNATVCINDDNGKKQLYSGTLSRCFFLNEYELQIGTNETINFYSDQIQHMSWPISEGLGP